MSVKHTEDIIACLNCMKFRESEFSAKLNENIFKTANKDLFRRIVCFCLSQYGDLFEEFLGKYKSLNLPSKVEAQFRTSLKNVVVTINSLYPGQYSLKSINQSFLIAPQGPKILDFLSSLCKITLSIKLEALGLRFVPPENVEEYDTFLEEYKLDEGDDINIRLEKSESRLQVASINDKKSSEEFSDYLGRSPFDVIYKTSELEEVEIVTEEWEKSLRNVLQNKENDIDKKKILLDRLICLIDSFKKLKETTYYSLDGLSVLNDLGFKCNISANIQGVELIENRKLDLNSLFKVCNAKYTTFMEHMMSGSLKLDTRIEEIEKELLLFDVKKNSYEEMDAKLNVIIDTYTPIVKKLQEDALKTVQMSEDPLIKRLKGYIDFERSLLLEKQPVVSKPFSGTVLPSPEEDLVKFILGNKADKLEESPIGSVKNSSFSLSRKVYFSGKKSSGFLSKRRMERDENKKPILTKGSLLKGLCDDRRATLASPSARRERFKIKHLDNQRKPLKPITSKNLFCSSSPLGSSAAGKSSSSTTLDLSPVKCSPDAQDISTSILLQDGCSHLNRSLSEPTLNISQEILKWENSSSDLDDLISPLASTKLHQNSPRNDSLERLILKFKTAKAKLNLSD